ncbi:hypothetical protein BS78_08G172500 [Paspalum vaginatum]|nr:hypothetical protein BS78_08G172500 [Paspalum vaginatum]
MADRGHGQQQNKKQKLLLALSAAVAAGLLLVLCGLTALASVAALAAAAPLLLLLSPVLVPAAGLACLLATGAMASGALALGALCILSRSSTKAPDDHDRVEQGKRRVGKLAAVAGESTPHAGLAVVSRRGQAATEHRKAKNYEHYVAGRMVQSA